MEIQKIDDSKVDQIIKEVEKDSASEHENHTAHKKAATKTKEMLNLALIFVLLALSLIQSIELINLRTQIQKGQFNPANNSSAPTTGGSQGLPAQQGGC